MQNSPFDLRHIGTSMFNTDFIQNIKNRTIVQIQIEAKLNNSTQYNSPKLDMPGRLALFL